MNKTRVNQLTGDIEKYTARIEKAQDKIETMKREITADRKLIKAMRDTIIAGGDEPPALRKIAELTPSESATVTTTIG